MHLLVIEDERALCETIVRSLRRLAYSVDCCYDGEKALELLGVERYDLVLLDLNLPKKDGMTVLRTLRQTDRETRVLILSARSEVEDKVQGLDAGANDYLTKPFAAKELLARIRAMTRAATAIDATTLSVGNVRLDTAACTLVGPLGEEHLANREFQLMELFMRNAGTRMPTERLMLEVWGEDAPEGANVVWVYISYLRKKLTALGADVAICASRNQGYSLEVVEEGE